MENEMMSINAKEQGIESKKKFVSKKKSLC